MRTMPRHSPLKLTPGLIWIIVSLLHTPVDASGQTYTIRDLGLPPNADEIEPERINESGQITGTVEYPTYDRGFHWVDGQLTLIGTLPGGSWSEASDADNLGRLVGTADTSSGQIHAILWTSLSGMQDLGSPCGPSGYSGANAINNFGVAAGISYCGSGAGSAQLLDLNTGAWTSLGLLPFGTYSSAIDINDSDCAAGEADDGYMGNVRPVRWCPSILDLGDFGDDTGTVAEISDDGSVCGDADVFKGYLRWAFFWNASDQNLNPLMGFSPGLSTSAKGMDRRGTRIVGCAIDAQATLHAAVWESVQGGGFQMTDLNTWLPPGSGWILECATDVNEAGQIVGTGLYNSQPAGFLLEPVDRSLVRPIGGNIGGTLAFRHDSPSHPGKTAVSFVSLSGDSVNLPLPGGVIIQITPDPLLLILLPLLLLSLDGQGTATTPAFGLPNNPQLVGLAMWVASGIYDPVTKKFVDASSTVPFSVIP